MTEALAKEPEEAIAHSEAHIKDYLFRGGADTEAADVGVGEKFGVGDVIKAAWANAKATEKAWLEHDVVEEERPSSLLPGVQLTAAKQEEVKPNLGQQTRPIEVDKPRIGQQPEAKPSWRRDFKASVEAQRTEPRPQEEKSKKAAVAGSAGILDMPTSEIRRKGEPVIGWPKEWPEPPPPPLGTQGPERLLYPKGLLGHAVQFVMDTAGLPDRKLALAVALSACAKGIDRKVIGPSGNTTILYTLVIAETGAGKQHGLDCVRALLRAMGLEQCYAAGGLASIQAIEQIIEGIKDRIDPNPNPLVVIDEIGAWLSRILSKGQTGNVSEIPSHLQMLWGLSAEGTWIGTKKLDKEMESFNSVAFAIIGFSTEKMFFKALKDRLIGSGFVNRMLLFNVGRGAEERVDPKYEWNQCPEWLVKAFRQVTALRPAPIHGPTKLTIPAKDGGVVTLGDFHRMGWGPGVKEACRAYEKQIRAMPSVDDRELWIRTHDIALRLATIVAVYRCSRTVEMADWEWAVELANHSTQQLKHGVDKHMLEDLDDADLAEHIRTYFRERSDRAISIGKVAKHFERKGTVRKLNEVIWHLEMTGDIVQVEMPPGPGRPTVYFRWNGA
jgi:hypothetical protein